MARGRMITNEIAKDKKVNALSCDTSRLAFTWLITFADVEGRTYGDPVLVKNMLFPRRDDVTTDQMTDYIIEWAENKMIIWYELNGDKWIAFPNFDRHQINLRKDREPASAIPSPWKDDGTLQDNCRILSGNVPEHIPVKRREEKLREEKLIKGSAEVFRHYETNIGALTPMVAETLGEMVDEYPEAWVIDAIQAAVNAEVRKLSYIKGVLKNRKSGKHPEQKREAFYEEHQ